MVGIYISNKNDKIVFSSEKPRQAISSKWHLSGVIKKTKFKKSEIFMSFAHFLRQWDFFFLKNNFFFFNFSKMYFYFFLFFNIENIKIINIGNIINQILGYNFYGICKNRYWVKITKLRFLCFLFFKNSPKITKW